MKLYIDYHTGAGNELVEGALDDAKFIADEHPAYTQQNITIEDEDGPVAERRWYGVAYDGPDDAGIIDFGDWGYYDRWHDYDEVEKAIWARGRANNDVF